MNNYRMTPLRNTRENKNRIIENVEQRTASPVVKRRSYWRPIVVVALVFLMIGISVPIMQQANVGEDVEIQRITIPNAEYPSLIQSQYVEETGEVLYEQNNTLYIYDIEQQTVQEAVHIENGFFFQVKLLKDWLFYTVGADDTIYALNRKTNETQNINIPYFAELNVSNHYITYLQQQEGGIDQYMRYDLHSGDSEPIRQVGDWDNLRSFIENDKLIIFEQSYVGKQLKSTISVTHLHTLRELGHFEADFRSLNNIQIRGDELFMNYIDEGSQKIGSYNLQTEQFEQLEIEGKVDDFATNGELFAVAVGNAGSSTVEMYRRKGDELIKMKTLDNISERLVRPRLYGNTFLINGETEGNPLYLIESK